MRIRNILLSFMINPLHSYTFRLCAAYGKQCRPKRQYEGITAGATYKRHLCEERGKVLFCNAHRTGAGYYEIA